MINPLLLPELREMLAEGNAADLAAFCTTLHPAQTADFMRGLSPQEAWEVLRHANLSTRAQVFGYFEHRMQVELIEQQDRAEVAALIAELPPDDRVDILTGVDEAIVAELLAQVPAADRRDILRLSAYPEGTAGALMTSRVVTLSESSTVRAALDELSRVAEDYETIYYLYIVDAEHRLRGLVSARRLIGAMRRPQTTLGELMETELVVARALEDRQQVARKVAQLDVLAIPVVDDEGRMLGIITHDDVIDVMLEEATQDAHQMAAVAPLEQSYLETSIFTLSWKRGIWLTLLFFFALLTAFAIGHYEKGLTGPDGVRELAWLAAFIPLVISTGGNSGNQSATLVITAMSLGHVRLRNWRRVAFRELTMGLILGSALAAIGFAIAWIFFADDWRQALVLPTTLVLVVIAGTLTGSLLPLLFKRLGLDPALMSNPFVAGIIDVVGIVIYMNAALTLPDLLR